MCDTLEDPDFGSVDFTSRSVGSLATYECNPGFVLVGPDERTCVQLSPGRADWNRRAPTCERE